MVIDLLFYTGREAAVEVTDGGCFTSEGEYEFYLNGEKTAVSNRTVMSFYKLTPDTVYTLKVVKGKDFGTVIFKTKSETVSLDVKDFGAAGDGVKDDTKAIQCAIMSCPEGGRVVVPEGTYKVYPLFLKSDMVFEIAEGAVLSAFTDRESFPVLPGNKPASNERGECFFGTWEGEPVNSFPGILTGMNIKNTVITGEGTVDGCASTDNWWFEPKKIRIAARPRMIFLNGCSGVTVHGITVKNSPSWNIHPYFSKDLGFYDIKILSPKISPNTDGLNPESCNGVNIVGVLFSVGDDCIAIKSGKMYMGQKYKTPSQNLSIRKCLMRDGHGAIVIGSENAGGVKDLLVEDCEFLNTDRGLRIKTRRGRGKDAIVDRVTFNRIKMDNVMTPVVINAFYFCDPDGHSDYVQTKEALPVDERTPVLGNFLFTNIEAKNCHVAAAYLYGLPEKKIESVTFENVNISFAKDKMSGVPAMMDGAGEMSGVGLFAKNVAKLDLKNVTVTGQTGEAVIYDE